MERRSDRGVEYLCRFPNTPDFYERKSTGWMAKQRLEVCDGLPFDLGALSGRRLRPRPVSGRSRPRDHLCRRDECHWSTRGDEPSAGGLSADPICHRCRIVGRHCARGLRDLYRRGQQGSRLRRGLSGASCGGGPRVGASLGFRQFHDRLLLGRRGLLRILQPDLDRLHHHSERRRIDLRSLLAVMSTAQIASISCANRRMFSRPSSSTRVAHTAHPELVAALSIAFHALVPLHFESPGNQGSAQE